MGGDVRAGAGVQVELWAAVRKALDECDVEPRVSVSRVENDADGEWLYTNIMPHPVRVIGTGFSFTLAPCSGMICDWHPDDIDVKVL